MTSIFNVSWNVQLNILWFGQMLTLAVLAMSLPYWPLYISQLAEFSAEEIKFWSAAIYVAPFITAIFFAPLWGKMADKFGYKAMVIRAVLGLFITQGLIWLLHSVTLILCARLLQGALAGFVVTAQAWALATTPQKHRGAILGKLESASAIGALLGPLLGGIIASAADYQTIFSSSTIICAVVAIVFFLFLQDFNHKNAVNTKSQSSTLPNKVASIMQQQIIHILFIIIIFQLAREMLSPIFSLFVVENINASDFTIGFLYAASGLMIFISAPYWGKYFDRAILAKQKIHYIISGLLFFSAIIHIFYIYATGFLSIFILRLLSGLCLGALIPILLRLLIHARNSHNKKAWLLAWGSSATKLGNLAGIVLGATIEIYFGFTHSFIMNAILYFLSGVLVLLYLRKGLY